MSIQPEFSVSTYPVSNLKAIETNIKLSMLRETLHKPNSSYIDFQNLNVESPRKSVLKYVSKRSKPLLKRRLKPEYRAKIACWIFEFENVFEINRSTLLAAITLLDRYLSKIITKIQELQLYAVAAVFVSAKLYEKRAIRIEDLSTLVANGLFSPEDIKRAEIKLMSTLGWRACSVTSIEFLDLFLMTFKLDDFVAFERIRELAEFFLYCTHFAYEFLEYNPSMLALCSILCATDHYRREFDTKHIDIETRCIEWKKQIFESFRVDLASIETKICCDMINDIFKKNEMNFQISVDYSSRANHETDKESHGYGITHYSQIHDDDNNKENHPPNLPRFQN